MGLIINPYSVESAGFPNTYSLDFDGVDDYVDCGNVTSLEGLSKASWSFWAKSSGAGGFPLGQWGSGTDRMFYTSINPSTGFLDFYLNGNISIRCQTSSGNAAPISVDTWYHYCFTYNNALSGAVALVPYINGVEIARTGFNATGTIYASTTNLHIGKRTDLTIAEWLGNIDEVSIWNDELTEAEVIALYNSGTPTDLTGETGLVHWWRMGDSTKALYFNSIWQIPDEMKVGNFSQYSFDFDGVDDYVNCGNDSSLQPTTAITLSAWFKIPAASLHFGADTLIAQDHTGYGGTHNGYSLDVTIASNGYLYYTFYLENGTAATQINGATNSAGAPPYLGDTWYNYVGTWDGSDMTLYINGEVVGTTAFAGPITYDATQNTWIGRRRIASLEWLGSMDGVSIWNVGKSEAEVKAIWNNGKPTDLSGETGLAGYWRMGESATWDGSDWTIPDDSTNSNDGTSDGMGIEDRVTDAPDNTSQANSVSMEEADRVEDVPS